MDIVNLGQGKKGQIGSIGPQGVQQTRNTMSSTIREFEEDTFCITEECVPIMLKAFASGTRFTATIREWEGRDTGNVFVGRHLLVLDTNYIRVTNDERRKLLPILRKLYIKLSSRSQK